ncbi:hypothetical protein HDK90DRAFT_545398 [Phyllosticta capitalensis]|uniref:Uncharacterized protein n=1 Tax=Phyllosticta capitalensis TaxID=121624 RepID=A0ABR1YYH3_9PEZI
MMVAPQAILKHKRLQRARQFLMPIGKDCAVFSLRRATIERMFAFINTTNKSVLGDAWLQTNELMDYGTFHQSWDISVRDNDKMDGLFAITVDELENPIILTKDTLYTLAPDAVWSYADDMEEMPIVHVVLLLNNKHDQYLAKGVPVADALYTHLNSCRPRVDLSGQAWPDCSDFPHPLDAPAHLQEPIQLAIRGLRKWQHPLAQSQLCTVVKTDEDFRSYIKKVEDSLVNLVKAGVERAKAAAETWRSLSSS